MSKHTPGPWYWDFDRDGLASLRSDHGDDGPIMIDVDCYPDVADRALIAAAPDLLEALETITALYADEMYSERSIKEEDLPEVMAARKAIARAKGEA